VQRTPSRRGGVAGPNQSPNPCHATRSVPSASTVAARPSAASVLSTAGQSSKLAGVVVRGSASARAGLVGNPSDAYGGAVVATTVPGLVAEVVVADADRLSVEGPADASSWPGVAALVEHVRRYGHEDAQRLVTAAVTCLARAAGEVDDRPFVVRWSTTVPRSVGLAGSSALVVATLRAVAARWTLRLTPDDLARLALEAERDELGIAAGLQDRAVQAAGATVLVDGDGFRPLTSAAPVPLVVAWDPAAASPSSRYHADLRRRFDEGDPGVVAAMEELAGLAREAATAVERGDAVALADRVGATWRVRRGLGAVAPTQEALVAAAASVGLTATSAGSGGSIVAVAPEPDAADRLAAAGLAVASATAG
jgi:glucuronokinase